MFLFHFLYTLLLWAVAVTCFFSHYVITTTLVPIFSKSRINSSYDLAIPFLKAGFFILGTKLSVSGLEKIPKNSNVIVISNHASLLDILVLKILLPIRITFFAKKELKKVPILGQDIKNMGHLFVDRQDARKSGQQLDLVEEKLRDGKNIILFPEGTRSIDGKIAPFKRGAFLLAAKSEKPLLPCYIDGTGEILNKKRFLAKPGNVHISIGDPIERKNTGPSSDTRTLSKKLLEKGLKSIQELQKNSPYWSKKNKS